MTEAQTPACSSNGSLRHHLPREEVLEESVRLLEGFADPTRFRILCLLRRDEVCVHDIFEVLGVKQSAVSHQLQALREARLVTDRKVGRHVYYRLTDGHVFEMPENALSHCEEIC